MRVTRRKTVLVTAMTALAVTAVGAGTANSAQRVSPGDWPTWQKDLGGSRFNPFERKITPRTVGNLKLKWAFTYAKLPYTRTGAQPAIVDGVLYVGAPDAKFFALDAKTGATKWSFDLTTVAGPVSDYNTDMVRDGAAVVGDLVYFGDSRGWLYALDKRTGKPAWTTRVDTSGNAWITGSPLVHRGRVFIGVSSEEASNASDPNYPCCTSRGQFVALDARTGKVDWRYYTVPAAQKIGTWPSGADKFGPSGVSVWSSPVVDPLSGLIYFGTGNNYTGTEGDTDSVIALDSRNGAVRWKQRMTWPDTYTLACSQMKDPGEYCPGYGKGTALDFDFGASPNLVHVHGRTLVAIGQKGGKFRAFDGRTGKLVWETTLSTPDLTKADPGDSGVQWGSAYDGHRLYAATWRADPGNLFALDPATGHVIWKTPHPADGCTTGGAAANPEMCKLAFTPAVTSTPGLIYEGSYDGKMYVFSSDTGKLLWHYDAIRDFQGVNGIPGRGIAISGNGGAVVTGGMVYVQAGYYPYYPSDKGYVLLAFGL